MNIVLSDFIEGIHIDSTSGSSIVKPFSVVLIEGNDKFFWITKMVVLIHIIASLTEGIRREFVFVIYFDLKSPIKNNDRSLNCL